MPQLLYRMVKTGLLAAGFLAAGAFLVSYLLQRGLAAQGIGPADGNTPMRAAVFFAAVGFGLGATLEALSAAWRSVFRQQRPPEPSANSQAPSEQSS